MNKQLYLKILLSVILWPGSQIIGQHKSSEISTARPCVLEYGLAGGWPDSRWQLSKRTYFISEVALPGTNRFRLLHISSSLSRQWWFWLLSSVLFVSLLYGFFRFRSYELAKAKKVLEKTVKERTLQLNMLLKEKEVLLKEIHHRVKNNLQIISGLLELQGNITKDIAIRNVLSESRNRLRSIALIHQELYQFKNLSAIEFNHFLRLLCIQVSEIFKNEKHRVKIENDVPNTELDIDTAIPLGLILNELLTNSYKYAFNETEQGLIKIQLQNLTGGKYELIYSDNGPGIPENYNSKNIDSIGMQLIHDLTRQIGGQAKYRFENGAVFAITFTNKAFRKKED